MQNCRQSSVKQNLELKKYLQGTTNVRNHAKATTRNYAEIFGNSIFTQQTFLLVPFLFPFQENKVKMVMGPCYQRRRHNDVAFSPSPPFFVLRLLSGVRPPPIAPRRLPQPPSTKPPLAPPTSFFGRYCYWLPLPPLFPGRPGE
jgi:hypothetical protein